MAQRIEIGIKAEHAVEWFEAGLKAARDAVGHEGRAAHAPRLFAFELSGESNDAKREDVVVVFTNDDMEREDVQRAEVYVSVEDD